MDMYFTVPVCVAVACRVFEGEKSPVIDKVSCEQPIQIDTNKM